MTEWRLIETAPTNGTPVLLFLGNRPINSNDIVGFHPSRVIDTVVGWTTGTLYMNGSVEWVCGICEEGSADTEGYSMPFMFSVYPTHWMPLPGPPKAKD